MLKNILVIRSSSAACIQSDISVGMLLKTACFYLLKGLCACIAAELFMLSSAYRL